MPGARTGILKRIRIIKARLWLHDQESHIYAKKIRKKQNSPQNKTRSCGFIETSETEMFAGLVIENKYSHSHVKGNPAGMREAGVNLNC